MVTKGKTVDGQRMFDTVGGGGRYASRKENETRRRKKKSQKLRLREKLGNAAENPIYLIQRRLSNETGATPCIRG